MNDPLKHFEELANKASLDVSPEINVQRQVMSSIARLSAPQRAEDMAIRFLVASALAAIATFVFTAFLSYSEPPFEMIAPFVSSLP